MGEINLLQEMDLFRFASLAADFCLWQTGAFQSPNPCTEPPCLGGSNPTQHTYLTKKHPQWMSFVKSWLRSVCNSRADNYMDLIAIGEEIKNLKDKLGLPNLY